MSKSGESKISRTVGKVSISVCLSVKGCRTVGVGNLVDVAGVRCGGEVALVFISRSRRLVENCDFLD